MVRPASAVPVAVTATGVLLLAVEPLTPSWPLLPRPQQ
jgi:hypothetical protein